MATRLARQLTLLAGTAMVVATPPQAGAQDARAAVEARYDQLATAIRRKDVAAILAMQSPAFSSFNAGGATFDYAAMEAYTRRLTAAIDSVIHVRNVIRQFTQHGDTVVADVCQEFSRIQRVGDRQRRVDTSVLQRETWLRSGGEWLRLNVRDEHGMRWFVDGVRIEPGKPYSPDAPAYAPAVDPPTGCGLR